MGIGAGIFLIALGAILTFAVHASLGFVSIQVVGRVLMAAGAIGLILSMWLWSGRRRTVVERPTVPTQPLPPDDEVIEERRRTARYPNDY